MELRQLDKRLDYYTPVIIASEDTLKNKPEMTKKIPGGYCKGISVCNRTSEGKRRDPS